MSRPQGTIFKMSIKSSVYLYSFYLYRIRFLYFELSLLYLVRGYVSCILIEISPSFVPYILSRIWLTWLIVHVFWIG
jgi:hypothetical protein